MFIGTFPPKVYLQEVLILYLQSWLKPECTYLYFNIVFKFVSLP